MGESDVKQVPVSAYQRQITRTRQRVSSYRQLRRKPRFPERVTRKPYYSTKKQKRRKGGKRKERYI